MNAKWDNKDFVDFLGNIELMNVSGIERLLANIGCEIKWGDSGIDDGCDSDCDDYVMYQSCDITDCDGETKWVTFYYGDNTREIGWINIH